MNQDCKVYATLFDASSVSQLQELRSTGCYDNVPIRIMPDAHSGKGALIGFTVPMTDKVCPNTIGVDIGCGMRVINLHTDKVDFDKLDKLIRVKVPSGRNVGSQDDKAVELINKLLCKSYLASYEHLTCSLGTLGGGNHFIEIDENKTRNKYLVIHTGSRNLGLQVADIYQQRARNRFYRQDYIAVIEKLKKEGRHREIEKELEKLKVGKLTMNKDLCYLENEDLQEYLHDMRICQEFAVLNRAKIATIICSALKLDDTDFFESVHNYIGNDNIIRKGAISAYEGQKVIIPLNMKDGCILGVGKGNADWNYSAPHGAGRKMSRSEAKQKISLEQFQRLMQKVYSTTVCKDTLDEAPQAYKPSKEIIKLIQDTVDVQEVIKPVYNFKSVE